MNTTSHKSNLLHGWAIYTAAALRGRAAWLHNSRHRSPLDSLGAVSGGTDSASAVSNPRRLSCQKLLHSRDFRELGDFPLRIQKMFELGQGKTEVIQRHSISSRHIFFPYSIAVEYTRTVCVHIVSQTFTTRSSKLV